MRLFQKAIIIVGLYVFLFGGITNSTFAALGVKQPENNAGVKVSTGGAKRAPGEILQTVIKNLIYVFFAVGGIGTLIMFLWGAVAWILSGGDKEAVAGARKRITSALIGVTILALTFVILGVLGQIIGFNILGDLRIPQFSQSSP